ncbi:MAG: prepilin-type N-terminal cleavage/methylation domain-containing protein, partial [Xanthomonadales bacterium]|nr:prepilin-type N-terminal cleavage/methylation domain-containing protein [Xanthomonadales bacterium]
MKKSDRGYSLMEMLIVVSLMATLLGLGVPSY